jgi:hypothetical protein
MVLSGRAALLRVTRELRRVKSSAGISKFVTGEVIFTDLDDATVAFSQEGASLLRNGQILQDKLAVPGGLVLTYLTMSGAQAVSASQIAVVRVKVKMVEGENRFVIESSSRIRN